MAYLSVNMAGSKAFKGRNVICKEDLLGLFQKHMPSKDHIVSVAISPLPKTDTYCGAWCYSSLKRTPMSHWGSLVHCLQKLIFNLKINPLIPDAHYSERQDKSFSSQIQLLEVDLKLNRGFLFFYPGN